IPSVQQDIQQGTNTIKAQPLQSIEDLRHLLNTLAKQGFGPSSICALELAALDLLMKSKGIQLAPFFKLPPIPDISYSLILPLLAPEKLSGLLQKITHFQAPKIKIKVNYDQVANLERIRILRRHLGEQIPIRVDVNGGWSLKEALTYIPELMALGVRSFEQILPVAQKADWAQVNRTFGGEVRIMADESLTSIQDAQALIEQGCCNHFNLKISKLGGLFRSQAIYQLAQKHGISCQLGAHFGETNILATAGVVLASLCPELTAYEGAMSDFLLEKDLGQPSTRHGVDGRLSVQKALDKVGWFEQIDLDDIDQQFTTAKYLL
ncbi:MAG: enolase C-terminal domain-like protein, partial [Bacteroidota bacterium]